ncbi:membrane dipeptidase [Microbacterium sp. ru370.1]|uniref:dipeptidase n=1 Tax=unclassified Microbacterium TaxID=2609290 RepID=UPI000880FE33|nr:MULTISPECIES: membrane dipeptidase [unclassified Microbacterium]SDO62192.1 membrane dipeptidase [Microbacterium sp. ru370.1]SIT86560.1 membrane dipeptidase [Microbacterium sp. RU1D]
MLWDQHACAELVETADLSELHRYRAAGGGLVSLNVGYAPHGPEVTASLLRAFRAQVERIEGLALAASVDDVDRIAAAGDTAVVFDLEDAAPLGGDLDAVAGLVAHGVRTLGPVYNHANAAGGGCLDAVDPGLTRWGRDLVAELNRRGMVPDGSHVGARTTFDMCTVSTRPVVFSHSNMRAVWDHPRNITDDQARAVADTGGVVGVTGVGIFLGPNTPTLEAMVRHLDHAVGVVGIEHVGVSTDFSFDWATFRDVLSTSPELYDASYTAWGPVEWMPPETFVGLGAALAGRGWTDDHIAAVLGGNFRRVALESWEAPE